MAYIYNLIKNIAFYKIIILLMLTFCYSLQCYSTTNNTNQEQYELSVNALVPNKPPPSYEDATKNTEILPTYDQALDLIDQTNTTVIAIEESSNPTTNNYVLNYLKKHKKVILIKVLPYIVVVTTIIVLGIIALADKSKLPPHVFGRICYTLISLILIYAYIEKSLVKKYITNSN